MKIHGRIEMESPAGTLVTTFHKQSSCGPPSRSTSVPAGDSSYR